VRKKRCLSTGDISDYETNWLQYIYRLERNRMKNWKLQSMDNLWGNTILDALRKCGESQLNVEGIEIDIGAG
jgi:hypothetical protein